VSATYKTVDEYWQVVAPRVNSFMTQRRDRPVEDFLESSIAVYSYIVEDLEQKRTANQHLAGHLESLVVLGLDYLRGAHAAQIYQSLATAALTARSAFEAMVTLKFIVRSGTPDVYAKRFVNFQMVERLRRHYRGRGVLSPKDLADLTAACATWLGPKTNQPKRECKWHGENLSIRGLADKAGELAGYESLYATNSLFTHGSSIVQNLYRNGAALQPLPDTKQVSRQSILTAGSCLTLVTEHARFFGVSLPQTEYAALLKNMTTLAAAR